MEVLLCLIMTIMSASNILCLVIGAKIGQKVSKGEAIETPTLNPLKGVEEHRAKKEAKKEQEMVDAIMRNIEAYDGTGKGQEDVPRG